MNGLMNRSSEFINKKNHVRKIPVCAKSPSKTLSHSSEINTPIVGPYIAVLSNGLLRKLSYSSMGHTRL